MDERAAAVQEPYRRGAGGTRLAGYPAAEADDAPNGLSKRTIMLKFLASTVGIIFLIGLLVVIGLLMLIF